MSRPKVFVTRRWPEAVENRLAAFCDATFNPEDIPLDEEGLLTGVTVAKYHEITYNARKTVFVLFSPVVNRVYIRVVA